MEYRQDAGQWRMIFIVVLLTACGRSLSLEGQSCSCTAGYTCGSNGLCVGGDGGAGRSPDASTAFPGPSDTGSDVGGEDASTSGGAGAGVLGGSDGPPKTQGLSGTWTGYTENIKFPSGSDAITLILSDGALTGTARLGAGSGPPPATNFEIGYPPDLAKSQLVVRFGGLFLLEGYGYTVRHPRFEKQRLRFSLASREPWTDWCAHQTSIPDAVNPGTYACVPNVGYSFSPDACMLNDGRPIDCGRLLLCDLGEGACVCDMGGCHAKVDEDVDLDLFVSGNEASGSFSGALGQHNVHLIHQP